jgi:hypothetical protein
LLQETGLVNPDGTPELRWHRVFDQYYDNVAIKNGIPRSQKAVTPAESARRKVLAEPIIVKRIMLCRTWWFRGEQHRSERGAIRARERAAEMAALTTCQAV